MEKRIETMLRVKPLKKSKQVCRFVAIVNLYNRMIPKRAHFLAPIVALTRKNILKR